MAREPKTLFGKLVKDFERWGEDALLTVRARVKEHGVPDGCSTFVSYGTRCGCPIAYANGYDPKLPADHEANVFAKGRNSLDTKFDFALSSIGGSDNGRFAPPSQYANKKSILFAIREALKNIRGRKAVTV